MAYYTYSTTTHQLLAISDFELPTPEDGSCTEAPGITKFELENTYVWNPDTLSFDLKPKDRILTKLEYMNRFTDNELATIYTVAKQNVAVEIWLEKFKLSSEVYLDDPRTVAGVQALEYYGLIGQGRAQEILQ